MLLGLMNFAVKIYVYRRIMYWINIQIYGSDEKIDRKLPSIISSDRFVIILFIKTNGTFESRRFKFWTLKSLSQQKENDNFTGEKDNNNLSSSEKLHGRLQYGTVCLHTVCDKTDCLRGWSKLLLLSIHLVLAEKSLPKCPRNSFR